MTETHTWRYDIARETHMNRPEDLLVDITAVMFSMAIYFMHKKIVDIRYQAR